MVIDVLILDGESEEGGWPTDVRNALKSYCGGLKRVISKAD
jgi:hypothetical protein